MFEIWNRLNFPGICEKNDNISPWVLTRKSLNSDLGFDVFPIENEGKVNQKWISFDISRRFPIWVLKIEGFSSRKW